MKKHICHFCGYEWESKIDLPKSCPKCKSYKWFKVLVPLTPIVSDRFKTTSDSPKKEEELEDDFYIKGVNEK